MMADAVLLLHSDKLAKSWPMLTAPNTNPCMPNTPPPGKPHQKPCTARAKTRRSKYVALSSRSSSVPGKCTRWAPEFGEPETGRVQIRVGLGMGLRRCYQRGEEEGQGARVARVMCSCHGGRALQAHDKPASLDQGQVRTIFVRCLFTTTA